MIKQSLFFLSLLAFVLRPGALRAEEVARLKSAQGSVESKPADAVQWVSAQTGQAFQPLDSLRTLQNSRAGILFIDAVLVRLNENSVVVFKSPTEKALPTLKMESGGAYFFSREPRQLPNVETPLVSAAVRGTEFAVDIEENQVIIAVLDGEVTCSNEQGSVQVASGEQAITRRGQPPVKQILVNPIDAVQWALYYPNIVEVDYAQFISAAAQQDRRSWMALVAAAKFLEAGQVKKAEESLGQVEQTVSAAPPEMQSQILAAAQAARSIIALVNNRKDEALALAQKAVQASPASASAALAMSYAEQAHFRLEEALRWAKESVRLQPKSGVTRARLAELYLGFGENEKAFRAAEEALQIAPDDPRVLTVLGFTHLTRYASSKAIPVFERAIALDPSNGSPHLGLGLALIRKGKLEAGRREMELAAHLEPGVSLFRSYLGKAYYEEKRDHLAQKEYEIAKKWDSKDPTPYLYSAFNKLAHTRPVEALFEIEDSIELNDNRAVYRSRLLLDQDQAVRNAGLSQVFTSVGFAQAARVEAIKSINRDYGNYPAHLMLAGSYFDIPVLNQATISELLLTRLLTPINFNWLDPSLRGEASFNEYVSLFDRQRFRLFFDGEGRTADDFLGGGVFHTGVLERFSYFLSYVPEFTDGFRKNDWVRSQSGTFLSQVQLTPQDTINFDSLVGDIENGDSAIGFNPNESDPTQEFDFELLEQRIGWHHRFGPDAHLVSQWMILQNNETFKARLSRIFRVNRFAGGELLDTLPDFAIMDHLQDKDFEGFRTDTQYIWDSEWVSLVAGVGLLDADADLEDAATAAIDAAELLPQLVLTSTGQQPTQSQRAYLYTTWHLSDWLDASGGVSYARLKLSANSLPPIFDDDTLTTDRWSPKSGFTWYLTPQTLVRGAYFQTLGTASVVDIESIEPTLVAGFNQLVDDLPGTRSETFGIGVDHKFTKRNYFGVELLRRKASRDLGLVYDLLDLDTQTGQFTQRETPREFAEFVTREDLLSAYYYQVLGRRMTGAVDYTVGRLEDEMFEKENQTHRIRWGLHYFHPCGLFARTAVTWRNQDLEGFGEKKDGIHDFWIWDGGLGYQFPKRYGILFLSVTNILDQDFRYEPTGVDPSFLPDTSYNLQFTLNF